MEPCRRHGGRRQTAIDSVGGGQQPARLPERLACGQVFADRYVVRVLDRADNAPGLDPKAVVTAARSRFPRWLPILVTSRFVMVTAGSLLVLVLVSLPISSLHYG